MDTTFVTLGVCGRGISLAPPLFVIAMEALNAMFCKADERQLVSPLKLRVVPYRVSLYADDVCGFLAASGWGISRGRNGLDSHGIGFG
jgi:hypothetical protein